MLFQRYSSLVVYWLGFGTLTTMARVQFLIREHVIKRHMFFCRSNRNQLTV